MNSALIKAAKYPRDSFICIQMFNWVSFLTMVLRATAGTFQWQITFSVTSIKSAHIFSTDISEKYEVFEEWVHATLKRFKPFWKRGWYITRWTVFCPC